MSLKYIRGYYNVPAKLGTKVIAHGREGTIVGAYGPYLRIEIEGEKHNGLFHPTWEMKYLPNGEEKKDEEKP